MLYLPSRTSAIMTSPIMDVNFKADKSLAWERGSMKKPQRAGADVASTRQNLSRRMQSESPCPQIGQATGVAGDEEHAVRTFTQQALRSFLKEVGHQDGIRHTCADLWENPCKCRLLTVDDINPALPAIRNIP